MVALKKGDLTAEEAMEIKRQIKEASKSNESGEFRAARSCSVQLRRENLSEGAWYWLSFVLVSVTCD